jgi:hypothetical protein
MVSQENTSQVRARFSSRQDTSDNTQSNRRTNAKWLQMPHEKRVAQKYAQLERTN